MSERYTVLFSIPERLYADGAPVLIAAGNLLKDNETGKVVVQMKLQNIGDKPIKVLRVRLMLFDPVGKPLGEPVDYQYLDLFAQRDDSFGQKTAIPLPDAATRSFAAEVTEVAFTDNSLWTASGKVWGPLPEGESLWSWLGDGELVKQYELQYGQNCECQPQQVKDLWLCACGELNRQEEASCHKCKRSRSALFAVDLAKLKADRDARLAEERQERERKEAEQKAAAEASAKRLKKVAVIVTPIVVVVAIFVIVLNTVIIPGGKYKEAAAAMDAGDYEAAIEMFTALGGFRDSPEQIETAKAAIEAERQAKLAAEEAERQAAEAERQAKIAAEEAERKAALEAEQKAAYEEAENLLLQGNNAAAAIAFGKAGEYSDAWERSLSLWNEIIERQTLSAGPRHIVGLRTDGTVVTVGDNQFGQCDVSEWKDIVAVSAGLMHTVGLKSNGTVVAVGDNIEGQCNVSEWTSIVAVYTSGGFTVGLRSNGTVVATVYTGIPDNYYGQCDVSDWKDIVAVAVSAEGSHTVGLRSDGTVVAVGKNRSGQCDVSDWTDIVAVSAGDSHTVVTVNSRGIFPGS